MRIDAHHHLWRYDPDGFGWIDPQSAIARDFGADDLSAVLARRGIDGAIAVQARQCDAETAMLLAAADRCDAILGVVGWIDLSAADIDTRLAGAADPRIVGYRHIVQDEADADFLLRDAFVRGVQAVARKGLVYDLLVDHRQLATVPAFIDRVGEGRFVLDHAAKPAIAQGEWQPWADRIAAAARCPQLSCKVSGLVTEADHARWSADEIERYLDHLFALFGTDRLIFGSDWPVCLLAAEHSRVFDLLADYVVRHCPAAAAAIFGDNALRTYAITMKQ